MTTYNRPHLLPRALESLTEQTLQNFDVVITNDAGTDPSAILAGFADRLKTTLITHPTNLGVTRALNSALAEATGKYITLLADDDLYLPGHLATLYEVASRDERVIPYTDGLQVIEDDAGNVSSRRMLPVPTKFNRDRLLFENYIPAMAQMIPRFAFDEAGGPFDPALDVLEDWDMWLRLSAFFEFRRIDQITFEYYIRGGRSNITTREATRFHACLGEVYKRHPVESGSRIADLRERSLTASLRRADAYLFDLTVAIASPDDPAATLEALKAVSGELSERSYEIVVVSRRTAKMELLSSQITGNISFVFTEGDPVPYLEAAAVRRSAGRRLHLITNIHELRLDELAPASSSSR